MRKMFIFLGFISALIAVIISVTELFQLAIAPITIAFVSGIIIIFLSKKEKTKTKTIQYIFLLVIISLSLTIYKSVFRNIEPNNVEIIEQQDEEIDNESKEILNEKEVSPN